MLQLNIIIRGVFRDYLRGGRRIPQAPHPPEYANDYSAFNWITVLWKKHKNIDVEHTLFRTVKSDLESFRGTWLVLKD